MSLQCCIAGAKDAPRIAEIHMAAFRSNAMLLAQFRTAEVRRALQHSIELKALADINDPHTTVLVVRRSGVPSIPEKESRDGASATSSGDAIIGFAKWAHPTEPHNEYEEPPWIWPEGTAFDVLAEWTSLVEEAQVKAIGSQPCYRKSSNGYERFKNCSILH
jgi:hypothetical protein